MVLSSLFVSIQKEVAAERRSGGQSRSPWWVSGLRAEWAVGSVHDRILRAPHGRALRRSAVARTVAHEVVSRSLRRAPADPMAVGLVACTLPDKPGSRLQRYRVVRPEGG